MKHSLLLFFALFSACAESQNTDSNNLPESQYASSHPSVENYRDNFFTIQLNNDSIICFTKYGRFPLDSISEIGNIYCQEQRKHLEHIKPELQILYPKIEADSSTRYELIDETVEILRHAKKNKLFFKTRGTVDKVYGFWLVFPEPHEILKPYLTQIYGNQLIYKCDYAPPRSLVGFILPLEEIKSAMTSGNYEKIITIEISNGKLLLNKKEAEYSQLAEAAQQPNGRYEFYIMLGKQNTYGDLIKILDLLYTSNEPLKNAVAQREFGKNYSELEGFSKSDISDEVALYFTIVSLSEQLYLNDKE